MIVSATENTDISFAVASDDLTRSPGNDPEVKVPDSEPEEPGGEGGPGGGWPEEQELPPTEPEGTTLQTEGDSPPVQQGSVETDKIVRIKFLSLKVLKTHLDPYPTLWKVWVGVKDNSSFPSEHKKGVVKTMSWVPVKVNQVFELYPTKAISNPNLTLATYFDVYLPEYQTKKSNTGLLTYAYGSIYTNSDVLLLKDNKLGWISEFYTSDEGYGLGQHTVTSSKGDYILVYKVEDISKPKTLLGSQDLSTKNLKMPNNTNTK